MEEHPEAASQTTTRGLFIDILLLLQALREELLLRASILIGPKVLRLGQDCRSAQLRPPKLLYILLASISKNMGSGTVSVHTESSGSGADEPSWLRKIWETLSKPIRTSLGILVPFLAFHHVIMIIIAASWLLLC